MSREQEGAPSGFHFSPDEPPSGGERKKIPLLPLTPEKLQHKKLTPDLYRSAIETILRQRTQLDRIKLKDPRSAEYRVNQIIAEKEHRRLHRVGDQRTGFDFELGLGMLAKQTDIVPFITPAPFGSDVVDHFDSAWILPHKKLTLLIDFTEDQGERLRQKKERVNQLGVSTPRGLIETGAITSGIPFVRAIVTPPDERTQQTAWYQKVQAYEQAVTEQSDDSPKEAFKQFNEADLRSVRGWLFDTIINESFAKQRAFATQHNNQPVIEYLDQAEQALRVYQK